MAITEGRLINKMMFASNISQSACGGIGRHVCLRNIFRKEYKFKSCQAHQQLCCNVCCIGRKLLQEGVTVGQVLCDYSSLRNYRQSLDTITSANNYCCYLCFFKNLIIALLQVVLQHTQQDCCISTQVQTKQGECSHYVYTN